MLVSTHIKIAGQSIKIDLANLQINSVYNSHHTFALSAAVPQATKIELGNIKTWLGENIKISITANGKESVFCGIVDKITPVWSPMGRFLSIEGFSPSILLDSGPEFRAYSNKALENIVKMVLRPYQIQCDVSHSNEKCLWTLQTQETDWGYLLRLADTFGKVFYYDGQRFHFGNFANGSALTLEYGQNLHSLQATFNLSPLKFKVRGYAPSQDRVLSKTNTQDAVGGNALTKALIKKSSKYPAPDIWVNHSVENEADLGGITRRLVGKQAHDLLIFQGHSDELGLKVGSIIKVKTEDPLFSTEPELKLLVVQVTHLVKDDDTYANSFTAIPFDHPYPIRTLNTRGPLCGPMVGTIKELKPGYAKISFLADLEQSVSPWLRILVPCSSYGGVYMPPKVGEKVLVMSEDFNLEKSAFILSGFWPSNTAEKYWDKENKKRGLRAKDMGLIFDETDGSVTIYGKKIRVLASESLKLSGQRTDINPKSGALTSFPPA